MDDQRDQPAKGGLWRNLRAALPVLLALGLFAAGLYAMVRLLGEVNPADVAAQVRATPLSTLAIAMLATLGGYLALVGYDWSALRYIGKPLPLPVTVAGGLMAYAFGNTIGLSAISGGAVRYRIYAGLGLDAYDVAAVSTFAAVSYGTAATLVGFAALVVDPGLLGPLSPLPPHLLRLVAGAAIAVTVLPLIWAGWRQDQLRLGRFTLRAPSLPVLVGQALFSLIDITCAALTLYVLMPDVGLDFGAFVGLFAAATMAGIMSHVPGGVGVFEAVILAALPGDAPLDKVAAALLLFRVIYFLLPFALALIVLAIYETSLVLRSAAISRLAAARPLSAISPALRAVSPLAPIVLAAMIMGLGVLMSFAALLAPGSGAVQALERVLPLVFLEGGALLASALGAVLIVLALGLARRSQGAYWLSLAALALGVLMALFQGLDTGRAVLLAVAALILLPFRREFHRRASLVHGAFSPGWFAMVAGLGLSSGFFLLFAYKGTPFSSELWWQFAIEADAPRALRAGLVAALMVTLASLTLLLRVPRIYPEPAAPEALARAARIVADQADPGAALALTGDKSLLFSDDGRGFVMFGVQGRSWIALGGPVGPPDSTIELGWAFADMARRAGARPVFYEVSEAHLPLMLELGLGLHKLGEQAEVDLTGFSLEAPARAKLRAAHARALRDGLSLQIMAPPHDAALLVSLAAISDNWLATRKTHEKQFSVGRFDAGWLNRWPLALVRQGDRIVAFANILRTDQPGMATVDLMRHTDDAPASVMDFLFIDLMLRLKAEGVQRFGMGMAPLSGLEAREGARLWSRFGAAIFQHGGHFYNFAGLRAFKAKFDPVWRPRYLAAASAGPPMIPITDATRLMAGGLRGVAEQ